jgi:hypothetical protein
VVADAGYRDNITFREELTERHDVHVYASIRPPNPPKW